jgi:two-component system phosphate regulon sensor histidine kinase PhoR
MLRVITVLSVLALTGLVVLQYFLLQNAYEFRKQAFERSVFAAMGAMTQKLEAGEASFNVIRVALAAPGHAKDVNVVALGADSIRGKFRHDSLSLMINSGPKLTDAPLRFNGDALWYTVHSPQKITLRVADMAAGRETTLVDEYRSPGEYSVNIAGIRRPAGEFVVRYVADSSTVVMRTLNGDVQGVASSAQIGAKRTEILGRALDNLTLLEREPLAKRIRPALLDSIVGGTLRESGIELPFAYGLLSAREDSLMFATPSSYGRELRATTFRTSLFPGDLLSAQDALVLYFPETGTYLLRKMGLFLALSVLFTAGIVVCFAYTLTIIVRQREFGTRLVDFINNMTHEFKTPISTIAVASETIARPEILGQPEKILRYNTVIQEENSRMKGQVDKILQMAVLEEGNYRLAVADVDVHEMIRAAVANIALQVEAKGGTVSSSLGAVRHVVRADRVHLANVINSLLDNANKYSPSTPEIRVSTQEEGATLLVQIADRGIGIAADDQRRVFEKYFRVHTGNLHDVKGFGLGLSYVKLITEAHGGEVSLESNPGSGTTVRLRLPLSLGGAE